MLKTVFLGVCIAIAPVGLVRAQDADSAPARGGGGVRSGNITSTGATVPNPGASQGAGTTSMDRGIQEQDNKIQGSICKGC